MAVQVGATDDIGVVAGVDAGGVGLQAQVAASVIHEQRRVGDVADAVGGHPRSAAVVQIARVVGGVRRAVVVQYAVVECAAPPSAAVCGRVAGQRADRKSTRLNSS